MSKRNISYVKPQDPSFLAKLKAEIGYQDGPSIETKKQKLEEDFSDSGGEERPEREDEKPQIVVVQGGDLTAEEAAQEEARLAREAAEAPADLNQRVIFKKRKPKEAAEATATKAQISEKNPKKCNSKKKNNTNKQRNNKLSFNNEDEEDQNTDSDQ